MPHRLPRRARLALNAVKLAVVASIVAIGSVGGGAVGSGTTSATWPQPSYAGPQGYVGQPVGHDAERTIRILDRHSCSTNGFDTGEQPLSAVVRSGAGKLRFVDFDTGWRIYTRRGAATLVAVCLDDPPPPPA
jgi:hypothetical protein